MWLYYVSMWCGYTMSACDVVILCHHVMWLYYVSMWCGVVILCQHVMLCGYTMSACYVMWLYYVCMFCITSLLSAVDTLLLELSSSSESSTSCVCVTRRGVSARRCGTWLSSRVIRARFSADDRSWSSRVRGARPICRSGQDCSSGSLWSTVDSCGICSTDKTRNKLD